MKPVKEKELALPHAVLDKQDVKLPTLLLPYQKKVNLAMETYPVLFVEKSRRIGITWGVAAQAVLMAAVNRSAGGMDVFYIAYNTEMTREFIDTCASWARAFGHAASAIEEVMLKDDDEKEIKAYRITFDSGFEIMALSSRPRGLRGRQGYVIIDEAAFHDDLAELMKAALALLFWGGRVLVISTHDGVENPFNEYIENSRKKKNKYHVIRIDFDDALKEGLYRRRCLVKGDEWTAEGEKAFRQEILDFYGEDADEELFCVPSMGTGAYIPGTLVEARMIDVPVIRLTCKRDFVHQPEEVRRREINDWCEEYLKPLLDKLDPKLKSCLGEDFARSVDLTVLHPMQIMPNLHRHTPFTVELSNVPFRQQLQIIWYIIDHLPRFMAGAFDARGNGSQVAEETMQRYGASRIFCIMATQQFYLENIPPYKAAFEDGTITIPRDDDIKADHRAIVRKRGIPQIVDRRTTGRSGEQRHGDAAVAGVLAWFASCQEVSEYAYDSINDPKRSGALRQEDDDDGVFQHSRIFGNNKGAF